MKMSFKKILTAFALIASFSTTTFAAPTCVLMEFTDETRFEAIGSAAMLSEQVLYNLISSGKFSIKEAKTISSDMKARLYEERNEEFRIVKQAMETEDYDLLFGGLAFDEKYAKSITSAELNQLVNPDIIKQIGEENGADYLIQGTINELGAGTNHGTKKQVNVLMVKATLRLIKVSSGEVIWGKIVEAEEKNIDVVDRWFSSTDGLNSDMHQKAIEAAAKKISEALIEDFERGKLFVK